MKIAGIDVGSTTTKSVIIEGSSIISAAIVPSGTNPKESAAKALDAALGSASLEYSDLGKVIATGHGRKKVDFANEEKAEIMATAKGARWLAPNTKIILDIGGQGIRVVKLEPSGAVEKFITNDKCSAGTGCFLDTMAFSLQVGLEEMGDLSRQAKTVCNMSTTCTIFAESEMVSLVARGTPKEDIIAGLHESVAKKMSNMIKGYHINDGIFMCGGVGRNSGVVEAFKAKFPSTIVPEHPQLVTAMGASLMGGGF